MFPGRNRSPNHGTLFTMSKATRNTPCRNLRDKHKRAQKPQGTDGVARLRTKDQPRRALRIPRSKVSLHLSSGASYWWCAVLYQTRLVSQRDPEVFFGQVFFWGPGVPRPRNHTVSGNHYFLKICFFLALIPQAFKKPLGQKTTSGSL